MSFTLPELPYSKDALAPRLSSETLEYHYGKHHKGYVDDLNEAIKGTDHFNKNLEEIIKSSEGKIYNFASQVWNNTFYWNSLSPEGGGEPTGDLASEIEKSFGSFSNFKDKFTQEALDHFGSGWIWLVKKNDGSLDILTTTNADSPVSLDMIALLTCDLWEHAYYIDYRSAKSKFIEAYWMMVNWSFAEENFVK